MRHLQCILSKWFKISERGGLYHGQEIRQSCASGSPTRDSDLEIVNTREKGLKRYAMVSELLEPRKMPMDIIVKTPDEIKKRTKIFDPFIRNILKTGKVIYEKPA